MGNTGKWGRLCRPLGHCNDFGSYSEQSHWRALRRGVAESDLGFNRIPVDALWRIDSQWRR